MDAKAEICKGDKCLLGEAEQHAPPVHQLSVSAVGRPISLEKRVIYHRWRSPTIALFSPKKRMQWSEKKEKPSKNPSSNQSSPPLHLPLVDQIPPGWVFYMGRGWVQNQAQLMPARAPTPPPLPQLGLHANAPMPFKTMFDGTTGKLTFFLNRAWSYINQHGDEFHDMQLDQAMGDNLENEASEWFTQLHEEGAPELNNMDDFLR